MSHPGHTTLATTRACPDVGYNWATATGVLLARLLTTDEEELRR